MSRAMVDLRLVLTANHSDPLSVSASWRLPQRLSHLNPFNLLGMRDKSYDATGVVYYDDRGAYMRVLLIQPLDPEPVELRVGRHHRRVRAHVRSEEHTSELQSPCNLVCRLLLEKKKQTR